MPRFAALILDWHRLTSNERSAAFCSRSPDFLRAIESVLQRGLFTRYELPAENLDDVFRILNIDHPADYSNRSLSVGDVVIDLTTHTAHACASVGWTPLPSLPESLAA